ncbi:MAG: M48 family metallopeptidase [Bacillota bacterium]
MRRQAFSITNILWALAVVFALAWTVSGILPRQPSQVALRYFDAEHLSRAFRRATLGYLTSGLAALATFAALYLFSRTSPFASRFSGTVTPGGAAKMGLFLGVTASALFSAVRLPFSAYSGYILEKKFGLSRLTFGTWIADYFKSAMLDLLAYGVGAAFLAWALVKMPRGWHIVATVAFLAASVVLSTVYPLVIAPAFNKFHPLEDGAILEDVRSLSEAAGMDVERVLVMEASAKTTRVNAYFAGVGRTREVVLYDTLIAGHSRPEIRLVIAHELGHWRYSHVNWGIVASTAGVFIALSLFRLFEMPGRAGRIGVRGFGSLEAVLISLLVFTVLFSYVTNPVSSFISRTFEVQSDAFSLALTGDRDAFITGHVNLAKANLSDVEPPPFLRWFAWTHPTTLERINSAK